MLRKITRFYAWLWKVYGVLRSPCGAKLFQKKFNQKLMGAYARGCAKL